MGELEEGGRGGERSGEVRGAGGKTEEKMVLWGRSNGSENGLIA